MRKLNYLLITVLLFTNTVISQEIVHPARIITGTFLGISQKISDNKSVKVNELNANRHDQTQAQERESEFELNASLRWEREYPYASTAMPQGPDPVWQNSMPQNRALTRAPILNFAGQSSPYYPSDCNGSVGANHFMQGVNSTYAIYDKNTGNQVIGATAFNTLFAGVPGATSNDGDIIVLYDDNADRWFAAEFDITSANNLMLIAVSVTNDPTGSWYRWSFDVDDMPDYMKFGIWEDGYYMSDNNTTGNDVYVFERSVMLTGGASPQMVAFNNPNRPASGFHCIQPLDNDAQFAPAGTPGQFITINDDAWGGGGDELWIYECAVDWATPSNSTFARTQTLTVPAFDSNFGASWDNITQPGTTQKLDAIPQILMYRAQYRNFGTTQTIVCAHSVDVDNTDHAGIRWYELQNTGTGWSVRQSGTYAPDGDSRWLPSIAMDGQHNISIAYSVSSGTTFPSIRYAAQSAAENATASGIMDIAEESIQVGTASQTAANRWGDYAEMSIDPVDDVTFWFTTEYFNGGKQTKIANWRFGIAALPPNTNFVINTPNTLLRPVPLLVGDDATYTNLTTGQVDTWAWAFQGGTPATSSLQDPGLINYPTAGLYDAALTASNIYGDSTLTRAGYIRVIDPATVYCDTMLQFYGTPTIYTSTGGYVSGTNEYDCQAIAEKYENFNPYNKITAGRFYWAKATNSTSPTVNFVVWGDDGSGNPGTQLAVKTLALADIVNDAATLGYTDVVFDADVILPSTGAFFIGFEMPGDATLGDTLAIVTNSDGDGNDNTGYSLYTSWNDYSVWGMTLMNGIVAYGCYDPNLAPVADFVGVPTTVNAGSTVSFTDLSYGGTPTSWSWSFSGGTPATSTAQNPTITYNTPGYYDVSLTVSNANGTDTETKTLYIHVVDANSCSCADLGNVVGNEVLYTTGGPGYVSGNNEYGDLAKAEYFDNYAPFTNLNGAYFSFGSVYVDNNATNITINVYADDGGNSGNGTYTYSPGTILGTVSVPISTIATDVANGDSTYVNFGTSINITGPFFIGFIIPSPTGGGDSLAVRTGAQNAGTDKGWEQWDNGNWYSYDEAGWGGSFNNAIYPVVCNTGAPLPDFAANNTVIAAGNTIDFTDLSTCDPTAWSWNFAGGTPATSTNQNPAITYNTAGTYDVTLTVTNADGSNSELKTAYITVLEPIVYWDFPNNPDNDLSDGGIPANTGTKSITTFGGAAAPSFGATGASTNAAIARTWGTGADTKGWQVDFTTTGYGSLMLYSKQNGDARSPLDWKVQYSTDGTTWTDLPGATITCATDWTTGVLNAVPLPVTCENQANVYLRWIMTSNNGIGGSIFDTRDNLIDDIMVVGIAIGAPPVADFTADNTSVCEGASVTFTDNSTNTPTSWLWDFGDASTSTLQNPSHVYSAAGTYTVVLTATNAAGSDSQTQTNYITVNANPTVGTSVTDVTCFGGNNGDATATPTGGQIPYSYLWNTGGTTATISSLTAGTYTVTVTDNNTCTGTGTATVNQPASAVSANITATTNVSCNGGSDGSATVTASNGTSPYTYLWPSNNTGATENGLSAGTYVVTVTDDNGCTTTASATISEPSTALATSISGNDVNCNGGNDGDATVSATDGTSPYTYLWTGGQTTASISNLSAGTYSVTVTDDNGCTSTETITINEPATALSTSISGNDVNCNGGNDGDATVTASGGTSPYTYLWTGGETTASVNGLTAGTYSVTVSDNNLCTSIETITINEPTTALATSITGNNISCNGANDGDATVTASGGTSPYTYLWSGGETTATITALSAGTYTCTISDNNSCSSVESIVITEPNALSTSISGTNVDCNGNSTGSASVTATDGTSPYTYLWSGGEITNTINGLAAGTYSCTITDYNSCSNIESLTITEPNVLTLSIAGTDANCNGSTDGSAVATVGGGTTTYTYAWSSGGNGATETGLSAGTYTLTVTDANSCTISDNVIINEPSAIVITETHNDATCGNSDGDITASATGGAGSYSYAWSSGGNTATISGLAAGTYTVTVTDGNTCINSLAVSISNVGGPTLTMNSTDATCNGGNDGTASVIAIGGTTPYSYLWSTSGTNDNISGLTAGSYSVTVSDGNSCSATGNVTINEPTAITAIETITDASCNGGNDGSISLNISGGTSPYSYSWSPSGSTNPLTGLQAGSYDVTITDNASCTQIFSNYTVGEPLVISVSQSVTDATCYGGSDGSVTLNVSGGTSPYTYAWSSGGNGATETGLSAGSYTVTISDNHSCSTIENITIGEGTEIILTMNSTDATCGSTNGSADVSVSGGASPYTYLWNTSETTSLINNLAAGTYSVTVTDNNLCNASSSVTVGNIGGPTLSMSTTDVSCFGANDGSATVSVTSGTSPYTYSWPSGGNTDIETGLAGGTYTVTVTDASSCSSTMIATINEPNEIVVAETITDASCAGCTDGSISVVVSGGTSPYTYVWSSGGSSDTETGLIAGTYSLTVTDANNCEFIGTYIVTEPNSMTITIVSTTDVSCYGVCDGSATISVAGGTSPYTYAWPSGGVGTTENGLCAGTWTVTVTDASSAISTQDITITEPNEITIAFTANDANCGVADGSASAVVSGGTSPYAYLWSTGASVDNISSISAGTYSLTVTDANSCQGIDSVVIGNIGGPTLTITQIDVSCYGLSDGQATVVANGGSSPYTYLWSSGGTSDTETGLSAGTYNVTVSDAISCSSFGQVTIVEPTEIIAVETITDVSCSGSSDGSISLSVTGGTSPYNYNWSSGGTSFEELSLAGGTYTVTITDNNACTVEYSYTINEGPALNMSVVSTSDVSCNGGNNGSAIVNLDGGTSPVTYTWDNSSIGNTIYNLEVGTYNVTAVDANGCTANTSVTINEPTAMQVDVATNDAHCGNSDGSAVITVNGGTNPYNYLWSDGSTSDTLNNLAMGIYIVTVTDANGCQQVITNVINNSDAPEITITGIDVSCNGGNNGALTSFVTGGTSPYTYLWSNGATDTNIDSLEAGTYTLTVTDANNCASITQYKITQPDVTMLITSEIDNASCLEKNDGAIQLNVQYGAEPYVFAWENGETSDYLENLNAGIYTVTITDANNCASVDSIVVSSELESCLHVYNTLTPNGDGKNDTWIIDGIENFPNANVKVFNQWGNLVWEHSGYYENWDGTTNGKLLPASTYYYILDLGNGDKPIRGDLTLIIATGNRMPMKPKTELPIMQKNNNSDNNSDNL